jgi:hypothetical protein
MAVKSRGTGPAAKAVNSAKRRGVDDRPKRSAKDDGKPDVRIFVSYSHHDAGAQAKLNTHLAPWRRDGVTVWYDENIEPGAALSTQISENSVAPISSSRCSAPRTSTAIIAGTSSTARHGPSCAQADARGRGGSKAVWLEADRAADFKLLPKDGIPPEGWSSSDAAYLNVAQGMVRLSGGPA